VQNFVAAQLANGRLKFSTLVNTPTPVDVEFGPTA
jgi:hypothetical protein